MTLAWLEVCSSCTKTSWALAVSARSSVAAAAMKAITAPGPAVLPRGQAPPAVTRRGAGSLQLGKQSHASGNRHSSIMHSRCNQCILLVSSLMHDKAWSSGQSVPSMNGGTTDAQIADDAYHLGAQCMLKRQASTGKHKANRMRARGVEVGSHTQIMRKNTSQPALRRPLPLLRSVQVHHMATGMQVNGV